MAVINCPRENSYEVVLSEMLANTTLSDIQNEYRGAIDEFVPSDSQTDYIRRASVTGVDVLFIKKTNEIANLIHSLGLIVVAKKSDATNE